MGIDIVHLAEFHFGRTPSMSTDERLRHLEVLHAECRRLSDDQFLLLPGEGPTHNNNLRSDNHQPAPQNLWFKIPGLPVWDDLRRGRLPWTGCELY